jgi:hypothetical protein
MRKYKTEKIKKLCLGFSQLNGNEQEHIMEISKNLLFIKLKTYSLIRTASVKNKEKKQE